MATSDNLNLYLPARSDYISVERDLTQNFQKIDTAYGKQTDSASATQGSIAIIADGDSHVAISAGQFVYVKNNTHSMTEGLYKATSNIAANATISSSVLTTVPSGTANDIASSVIVLDGKCTSYSFSTEYSTLLSMISAKVVTNGSKLPFSFVKVGNASLSDIPSDIGTAEFIGVVQGDYPRVLVTIFKYGEADKKFIREIWNGSWRTESWTETVDFIYINGFGYSVERTGNFKIKAIGDENEVDLQAERVIGYNHAGDGYIPFFGSAFNTVSTKLIKENIHDIPDDEAKKILDVRPVSFDYKKSFGGQTEQYGVIAEEVEKLIPYVVSTPNGYSEKDFDESKGVMQPIKSVDYSKFVPYLIKMIQIQQKEIDELKSKRS